jgi:hypothetical protein
LTDTVVALTTLAHCTMQVDKMRSLATLIGVSSFGWEQNSNNLHEIHAIDYINDTIDEPYKIHYFALDYIHISKHQNLDVITWSCLLMLCCLMEMAVELFITGIFRLYGALSSC